MRQVLTPGAPGDRRRRARQEPEAGRTVPFSGKTGVLGFFVGQVMKETRGQANPSWLASLPGEGALG
ncbi:MAG: hypothetical protein R3B07_29020 [Polyangiaceae bacterium]